MNDSRKKNDIGIGTSGYQYDHWQGVFYPDDLPKAERFKYYTRHFDTVEINNTFYNLPTEKAFDKWREDAPDGFCYSLKFSRYGSHLKHLKDPEGTVGLPLSTVNRSGFAKRRRKATMCTPISTTMPKAPPQTMPAALKSGRDGKVCVVCVSE